MADIAEIQMMKVSSFTAGVDVYKGILEAGYRENPLNTIPVRLEGQLRASRLEQVETDTPPVTARFRFSGPAPSALLDATLATASVTVRDATTAAGTKTITFTNLLIKSSDANVTNRQVNGVGYEGEATAVSVN